MPPFQPGCCRGERWRSSSEDSSVVLRLSSNLIVEVRRTVSYRGLVLHLHVSSEVYCGDVCGEQHQVAVDVIPSVNWRGAHDLARELEGST